MLQPEGDTGNAVALTTRAQAGGVTVEHAVVHPGDVLRDDAQVYLLGGSEDTDVAECARRLRMGGELRRAVDGGAVVFAVGAGFQVLGHRFQDLDGRFHDGIGLLDVVMSSGPMAAGPVVTEPNLDLGLPAMSGYEHHVSTASLGPGSQPLAALEIGMGNGPSGGLNHDGAVTGRVVGTWLHGPVLPRNPELADLLLRWSGIEPLLQDDSLAARVRVTRLAQARARR